MSVSLYIVQHGVDSGLYKIGIAANVKARIAQLQIGNPVGLRLAKEVECPSRAVAFGIESALHSMMESEHVTGEWFSASFSYIMASLRLVVFDTPDEGLVA